MLLGKCDTDAEVEAALAALTPPCRPTRATLAKLISKYAKAGHWRRGIAIFKHLHLLSVAPDNSLANSALWACRRGGDAVEAWRIFDRMLMEGLDLNVITYRALFSVLATAGDWQASGLVRAFLPHPTPTWSLRTTAVLYTAGISRSVRCHVSLRHQQHSHHLSPVLHIKPSPTVGCGSSR